MRKTAPYLDGNVNGGVGARVMEYLDGFHYQDGTLRFFPTAEGYVEVTQTKDGESYSYVFNYTDHLGNIRLSYAEDPQSPWSLRILEENHYYPFGLKHTNYNSDMLAFREGGQGLALLAPQASPVPQFPYNYKYNGKELQDEMGMNIYDYGTRNYDPAIGRWMNIDPLAEQGRRWSPYAYAFDNPVYFIDPDGRWPWPVIKALASVANDKWDKAWKKSYNRKTYNHDIAKAPIYFVADILENANTYKRKKIEISNKDINSTATSKNGGGENQKSKGKKKRR
ncbi:RHS repeat-associated core domain-containing protein [uncultured Flavobacterium sp.]|uniref:RHS repeat domain-containing protein n=1 Tax=uncultured Flavobacterium sp. TaxID=165435 RepID=UPI0027E201AF|nr:RHS repeat-associated core domain-containing protein [uncultured Flavobacterium sp.]